MTTDPFAQQEKTPSISFKDKPIGTSYTGKVVEAPQIVHARDFETGEPDYWDKPHNTQPKKSVVTILEINGERLGLWAPKPSAMFRAIADAQTAAGAQIAVGGTITVTFIGEQPNEKNPRLNPQKLYSVVYQPNDPFAAGEQHINPQTGEVTGNGPQPEWSLPQQPPPGTYNAPISGHNAGPWPQSSMAQQPIPPQTAPQAAPKQHSAETIAALKAAGLDPAKVPVL